jgi:hypothetical protein
MTLDDPLSLMVRDQDILIRAALESITQVIATLHDTLEALAADKTLS